MKRISPIMFISLALLPLLSSCASYKAVALSNLSIVSVQSGWQSKSEEIQVVAKAFNKSDCKRYLDRDVIAAGYQPVQLYIQNNSNKPFIFSVERVSLPCATAEEVAEKTHTSTVGRATGYAAGGLFFWPLFIPAIIDGVKSSQANSALDIDFSFKVACNQTIFPYAHFNKILFVPQGQYQSAFSIVLLDGDSGKPKKIQVSVI